MKVDIMYKEYKLDFIFLFLVFTSYANLLYLFGLTSFNAVRGLLELPLHLFNVKTPCDLPAIALISHLVYTFFTVFIYLYIAYKGEKLYKAKLAAKRTKYIYLMCLLGFMIDYSLNSYIHNVAKIANYHSLEEGKLLNQLNNQTTSCKLTAKAYSNSKIYNISIDYWLNERYTLALLAKYDNENRSSVWRNGLRALNSICSYNGNEHHDSVFHDQNIVFFNNDLLLMYPSVNSSNTSLMPMPSEDYSKALARSSNNQQDYDWLKPHLEKLMVVKFLHKKSLYWLSWRLLSYRIYSYATDCAFMCLFLSFLYTLYIGNTKREHILDQTFKAWK